MAVSSVKSSSKVSKQFQSELKKAKNVVKKDAHGIISRTEQALLKQAQTRSQVYATVDGGRLHVALDENYTGSINSYNNFITKLFARIFGWSAQVAINGITHHVDKADYTRWLNNNVANNEAVSSNLVGFLNLNLLDIKPAANQGYMRDHLSAEKTRALFEKMVVALTVNNDLETAKECIGSGAKIDDTFWIRDHKKIQKRLSLTTLKAGLAEDKALDIQAKYYTPLLYAADKNNKVFVEFLRRFGADTSIQGESVRFIKRIMEVNPFTTFKEEKFTASNGQDKTRITMKTTVVQNIEDEVIPKDLLRFDPELNAIANQENRAAVVIEKYTRNKESYTTRYVDA